MTIRTAHDNIARAQIFVHFVMPISEVSRELIARKSRGRPSVSGAGPSKFGYSPSCYHRLFTDPVELILARPDGTGAKFSPSNHDFNDVQCGFCACCIDSYQPYRAARQGLVGPQPGRASPDLFSNDDLL